MDHILVIYLNQFAAASPVLSGMTVFLAHYLPWLVSAAFVVFILTQGKYPFASQTRHFPSKEGQWGERLKHIAEGFGAATLAWLGSQALRLFIHRPRPFVADLDIVALVEKTTYSFPSGHAAFFFALATAVYLYNKRGGLWLYAAAAIIGLARIAAGVHYPTDILGGAALGVAVGYLIVLFLKKSRTALDT